MAHFKAFSPQSEVLGATVIGALNVMSTYKDKAVQVLITEGITDLQPHKWYKQQALLNYYKHLYEHLGPNSLFLMGKTIAATAELPPTITNLEQALLGLDVVYQMNHRGGKAGHYKLLQFDGKRKTASFECYNPYPCDLDRGILTALCRRFKPKDTVAIEVNLDPSKPNRSNGAASSHYIIKW